MDLVQLRRYRRSWRSFAKWALLAAGAVCLAGLFALVRNPSWYLPPQIPPEQRQKVRNSLIAAEQAFTENLLSNEIFVYHIYQEDVNRWIAMRREIYPLIDELAPPILEEPLVVFDDNTITLAGRYRGTIGLILSLDIDARFGDGRLQFKARSTRCGSMRMPVDLRKLRLDGPADNAAGSLWPGSPEISGNLVDGILVDAHAWWQNGGMDYRVVDFSAHPGELILKIQPLGRHQRGRDDESGDIDQP